MPINGFTDTSLLGIHRSPDMTSDITKLTQNYRLSSIIYAENMAGLYRSWTKHSSQVYI